MKRTIKICALLLFTCSFTYGQMEQYNYKRELKDVSQQWYKIILPADIFSKTTHNLNDIRIFGITSNYDTIEAPYLLQVTTEKVSNKEVVFKTLNASHNDKGYYFTFEILTNEPINRMDLEFRQTNFDWRITLEGSQDQHEWFTVIENYRILSIKNELTDFQFTQLAFPSSKYRYFRLLIDSSEKPKLEGATIALHEIVGGEFKNYPIKQIGIENNKQTKQTEIETELQLPIRASSVKIVVSDTFDYYRPVTIKYLTDSFNTEKGWKYNYRPLTSGTLNSMEENEFRFNSTTIHKLKIFINNHDNQPLNIDTIKIKGYVHELVVRFTKQANYFLTYGNERATKPQYDIHRFTDQIPTDLTTLEFGNQQKIKIEKAMVTEPLFKSKVWLWVVMTIIILLLGWFSVKMIRKN